MQAINGKLPDGHWVADNRTKTRYWVCGESAIILTGPDKGKDLGNYNFSEEMNWTSYGFKQYNKLCL